MPNKKEIHNEKNKFQKKNGSAAIVTPERLASERDGRNKVLDVSERDESSGLKKEPSWRRINFIIYFSIKCVFASDTKRSQVKTFCLLTGHRFGDPLVLIERLIKSRLSKYEKKIKTFEMNSEKP